MMYESIAKTILAVLVAPLGCSGFGAYLVVRGVREWRDATSRLNDGGRWVWFWFNKAVAAGFLASGLAFLGFAVFWAVFLLTHSLG